MTFRYSETCFDGGGILFANDSPTVEKCLQNLVVIVTGSYLGTPSLFIALILSPLLGVLFRIVCINFQSLQLFCLYSLYFSLKYKVFAFLRTFCYWFQ